MHYEIRLKKSSITDFDNHPMRYVEIHRNDNYAVHETQLRTPIVYSSNSEHLRTPDYRKSLILTS